MIIRTSELNVFPGGDLVASGLADLEAGIASENALLVSLASPRLLGLGFDIPVLVTTNASYEHRLFSALEDRLGGGAHAAYNSLLSRIVSFANAFSFGN